MQFLKKKTNYLSTIFIEVVDLRTKIKKNIVIFESYRKYVFTYNFDVADSVNKKKKLRIKIV